MASNTKIRENKIKNIYNAHGAKLFNGHGLITGEKKKVPNNTILMFLAPKSYCMFINTGGNIQRMFFENEKGLLNFFKSGRSQGHVEYVTNILSKTHFPPGTFKNRPNLNQSEYYNMNIYLRPENGYPGMGYIKKLPILTKSINATQQRVPTYPQTVGPVRPGVYRLSQLLRNDPNLKKGGVFIISACRVHLNNHRAGRTPARESREWNVLKRGTPAARATLDPEAPPARGYRLPTRVPELSNKNKSALENLYTKLRGPTQEQRIQVARNILNNKNRRQNHANLRSVLSAAGIRANFGSTNPNILEELQRKFNKNAPGLTLRSGVKLLHKK
jgi:hypothetical protein